MRKSFNRICFMIPLLLFNVSCFELEQEVLDGVTAEQLANSTNPNLVNVLKASAYNRIIGTWGGHNSLWSVHEVSSDEMAIPQKGDDWLDGGEWLRMHRHEYTRDEPSLNNSWSYCYTAIGDINILLSQYPQLDALQAELKVLRALVYLWLIDAFGNVPIIDENSVDATPPAATRQEVFNFIESQVLENLEELSRENTKTTVNYWVAKTILAKLYINAEVYTGQQRWADANLAATEVIESGVFSLASDFFSNFATNNAGSPENIFTINYDQNNAPGFNLHQMTLHYLSRETYNFQDQPWNGYTSLEEFYNSFDDEDVRKGSFIVGEQFARNGDRLLDALAEPNDPDGPPLTFTPNINMLAPNALRQAGARVGKFEFAIGATPDLSNDFPIFRFADVLLIKAEALMRQGQGAAGLGFVNEVRARANLSPLTELTPDILLAERGREMFAEGWRRSDLIRLGGYSRPWWEKTQNTPPFRYIFPIPFNQLQANPNLQQNPGY